jgi:hypothetical protein
MMTWQAFTNITAREMLDHLFFTYGNITIVDLKQNLSRRAILGIPAAGGDLVQANSRLC